MTKDKKHLYYLDELKDYKVKSDNPDVRGWDVKDHDNRVIGKVDDFLVHKDREQVVYVDIEVDEAIIEENHDPYAPSENNEIREFVNKEGENHLIIPIGLIDIDEDRKYIWTDKLDYRTFAGTKRMQKGAPIHRDYEMAVLGSYRRKNRFEDRSEAVHDQNFDAKDTETKKMDLEGRQEANRHNDGGEPQNRNFETKPDDSFNENFRSEESIKREKDLDKAWQERNRDNYDALSEQRFTERTRKEDFSEEDSFYNRSEFDRTNYWKKRNE